MRTVVYSFLFMLCSLFAFSQKATEVKLSVADYEKAQNIKEFIKDIPADCEIKTAKVSVVVKGVLLSTESKDGKINWNREGAKAKDFIIVESIVSTCKGKIKNKYKIILE